MSEKSPLAAYSIPSFINYFMPSTCFACGYNSVIRLVRIAIFDKVLNTKIYR